MISDLPKIKAVKVRTVSVPLPTPHRTASGVIAESPLVLTDILLDNGIEGHSIIFTYNKIALKPMAALVAGLEGLIQNDGGFPGSKSPPWPTIFPAMPSLQKK